MSNTSLVKASSVNLAPLLEKVFIGGDLSQLSPAQKLEYVQVVCQSIGINHLTRPFEFLKFQGKEILYARKDCTDQLRAVHDVSVKVCDTVLEHGLAKCTAISSLPSGRFDSSLGAVAVEGLKGEALANALMKAETKAKRRATLSICGLGVLDESELDTLPTARQASEELAPLRRKVGELCAKVFGDSHETRDKWIAARGHNAKTVDGANAVISDLEAIIAKAEAGDATIAPKPAPVTPPPEPAAQLATPPQIKKFWALTKERGLNEAATYAICQARNLCGVKSETVDGQPIVRRSISASTVAEAAEAIDYFEARDAQELALVLEDLRPA